MKKIVIVCVTLLIVVSVQAQTLTEKYLKMTPVLPKDTCNITRVAVDNFVNQVSQLSEQLSSEIESLENMANNQMKDNEEVAKANAMKQMSQQYGLSPEQMQKMQSGKMSEADKQALANQVMQQQTNMSMGEVQNLSKMSDAGKKAYMEAYGTEMAAAGQTPQNKQNATYANNMNQLMAEQQAVMGRLNASGQKISELYAGIENDPNLQKSYQNIEKWKSKQMSMVGVDYGQGKQMDSLGMLIQKEQVKICDKYTPKYRAAVRQHFDILKTSLPDHEKLSGITAELTKIQTGIVLPDEYTEVGKLQSLKGYLSSLKDAYKFKLYFPE